MPAFRLDEAQQAAILTRLAMTNVPQADSADAVHYRMLQLNCYACHRRDSRGGVGRFRKAYFETAGNVDLGDEGRLPPPLTGVGKKLTPKALASVFHPKSTPHRPYMSIRMPTYHADVIDSWIKEVPKADDVDASNETQVFPPGSSSVQAGRHLMDTGCVGCHVFGGESLPGVVGIDLSGITNRVRPAWFRDFILDPGAVKDRTRMPTFFPDGKSNRPDLLEGDVDRQIASLWAYLKALPNEELPKKIEEARAANYELSPSEEPIVLRTFMEEAGTHAIAVGFPQGIHIAFDAENARLAVGWKGRFLDARGTWFERFAPPAIPLGERIIGFPEGSLIEGSQNGRHRFLGYRLDDQRIPVFLYEVDGISVEDKIMPTSNATLQRRISIRSTENSHSVDVVLHSAKQLREIDSKSYRDEIGLTVSLPGADADNAVLKSVPDRDLQLWTLPIDANGPTLIHLEYQW